MSSERWGNAAVLEWADPERTGEVVKEVHTVTCAAGTTDLELGLLVRQFRVGSGHGRARWRPREVEGKRHAAPVTAAG